MKSARHIQLNFVASRVLVAPVYMSKEFSFETQSEQGVWRIIKKFKESGNVFHFIEIRLYNDVGINYYVSQLQGNVIEQLNNYPYERWSFLFPGVPFP